MFSVLIILFSSICLALNIFLQYTENPLFNAIFLALIVFFSCICFLSFSRRQKIFNKQDFTIREILYALGLDLKTANLNSIRSNIDDLKYKLSKSNNEKDFLRSKIKLFGNDFKIAQKLLNYVDGDEKNNELLSVLKTSFSGNQDYAKEIINEVSAYKKNYEYQNDKKIFYDGCSAAIVLQNPLKSQLLKLYLGEFGINANIFNDNNVYYERFDIVFIDEMLCKKEYPNMVFFGFNAQKNRIYLNDDINKRELAYILSKFLSQKQVSKNTQSAFSVLIFGDNSLQNSILLNNANACVSGNCAVDNLTDFKKELQNQYKLIILSKKAIAYDYDNVKSKLIALKNKNSYLKIAIILNEDLKSFEIDYDFIDFTINKDESGGDFMRLIKDNT